MNLLDAMAKQYDVLYRLLLLGDSGVGKTSLLCRLTDNEFFSPHVSTIATREVVRSGIDVGQGGLGGAFGICGVEGPLVPVKEDLKATASRDILDNSVLPTLWPQFRGMPRCDGVDFKMKTVEVNGIKVRIQIWDTAGQEKYQTITKQYYRRAQGIFLVYDITSSLSFQHIVKWISDVDENAPHIVRKILVGNKHDEEHRRQVTTEQGNKLAKSYGMDFLETSAFTNYNINEAFTQMTSRVLEANRKELHSALPSNNDELSTIETGQEHEYSTCSC